MASQVDIYNMSLRHIGSGRTVSATTERSEEARACNAFYEIARDATLRDCPLPFSRRYVNLGLVEEDPVSEWQYSYRYPSDCLATRRIVSGNVNESYQAKVRFQVGGDSTARLVYTNEQDAAMEYTARVEDTLQYPEDFILALSYRLAHMIAPSVAQGDGRGIAGDMLARYRDEVTRARANAFNEQQEYEEVESEFIRVRGGSTGV